MLNFWWKKRANFRIRDGASGARGRSPFVTFLVWTGSIMLALWFVYPRALSWVFMQSVLPFASIGAWYDTSMHAVPTYFRGIDALRAERDALQKEVSLTEAERLTYAAMQQENNLLRKLSGDGVEEKSILAGVLAAPPYVPYDLMIIDRGAADGVNEGMYAYDEHNNALGITRTVYDNRTIVQLFSSPNAMTTVYMPGVRLFATAEGVGNGVIRVRVPQDITLPVGSLVVLPGISSSRIGEVTYLEAEPTNPEQSAYITTYAPHVYQFIRIDTRPRAVPTFDELRAILRDYNPQLSDITLPAAYVKEPYESTTTPSTGTTSASTTAR